MSDFNSFAGGGDNDQQWQGADPSFFEEAIRDLQQYDLPVDDGSFSFEGLLMEGDGFADPMLWNPEEGAAASNNDAPHDPQLASGSGFYGQFIAEGSLFEANLSANYGNVPAEPEETEQVQRAEDSGPDEFSDAEDSDDCSVNDDIDEEELEELFNVAPGEPIARPYPEIREQLREREAKEAELFKAKKRAEKALQKSRGENTIAEASRAGNAYEQHMRLFKFWRSQHASVLAIIDKQCAEQRRVKKLQKTQQTDGAPACVSQAVTSQNASSTQAAPAGINSNESVTPAQAVTLPPAVANPDQHTAKARAVTKAAPSTVRKPPPSNELEEQMELLREARKKQEAREAAEARREAENARKAAEAATKAAEQTVRSNEQANGSGYNLTLPTGDTVVQPFNTSQPSIGLTLPTGGVTIGASNVDRPWAPEANGSGIWQAPQDVNAGPGNGVAVPEGQSHPQTTDFLGLYQQLPLAHQQGTAHNGAAQMAFQPPTGAAHCAPLNPVVQQPPNNGRNKRKAADSAGESQAPKRARFIPLSSSGPIPPTPVSPQFAGAGSYPGPVARPLVPGTTNTSSPPVQYHGGINPQRIRDAAKSGITSAAISICHEAVTTGTIFKQPLMDGLASFAQQPSTLNHGFPEVLEAVMKENPADCQRAAATGVNKLLRHALADAESTGTVFGKELMAGPIRGDDLDEARRDLAQKYKAILSHWQANAIVPKTSSPIVSRPGMGPNFPIDLTSDYGGQDTAGSYQRNGALYGAQPFSNGGVRNSPSNGFFPIGGIESGGLNHGNGTSMAASASTFQGPGAPFSVPGMTTYGNRGQTGVGYGNVNQMSSPLASMATSPSARPDSAQISEPQLPSLDEVGKKRKAGDPSSTPESGKKKRVYKPRGKRAQSDASEANSNIPKVSYDFGTQTFSLAVMLDGSRKLQNLGGGNDNQRAKLREFVEMAEGMGVACPPTFVCELDRSAQDNFVALMKHLHAGGKAAPPSSQ